MDEKTQLEIEYRRLVFEAYVKMYEKIVVDMLVVPITSESIRMANMLFEKDTKEGE